jgi:hypothetical protein
VNLPENVKIEPISSEMHSTASNSKSKSKKKAKEHYNDLQVSNFVQARMWCTFILGWHLLTVIVMLIFAFS